MERIYSVANFLFVTAMFFIQFIISFNDNNSSNFKHRKWGAVNCNHHHHRQL